MDSVLIDIDSHRYSLRGLAAIGIGIVASVFVLWEVGKAIGARPEVAGPAIAGLLLFVIWSLAAGLPGSLVLQMAPAWLGVAFMTMVSGNSLVSVPALMGAGGWYSWLGERRASMSRYHRR